MGDSTKFLNTTDFIIFNIALGLLLFTELIIMFSSIKAGRLSSKKRSDSGTLLFILLAFFGSIFLAVIFRSRQISQTVQSWLLPYAFFYIGVLMILLGILIRVTAVLTLKQAFTLAVQTSKEQHLVQTGLYRIVRNPAYSGSIISLLGVTLAYRHILGAVLSLILCFICYSIRIHVEEKAMLNRFQQEFKSYCLQTKHRLFPGIY
ncbi:protein-S-isoprenylcysteine O-methyltransferase Ste14 [Ruminiclostridium sufflavum DSM 19573]|uniref:Protein-S-isoprenylcysteine O-methyltransferase Ste14 n=1 Tax=Ruminiclostridium sufflavum DSM 19573 TaxID=1121337 RepID=A0A318XRV9_9FIRM|nr:isoprenylcysteine carboxylmethyltransferase family protein [Ruminiclostridium sufflavum]PYG88876.1 protein-S-isoprenylcysteine O-methyltransferase Ste14 [Ruminiclostridium sufflavum DSM 19573]